MQQHRMKLQTLLQYISIEYISIKGKFIDRHTVPITKQQANQQVPFNQKKWWNVSIAQITCDSRQVVKGGLFVAITGQNIDGHHFINEACLKASVIVLDKSFLNKLSIPKDFQGPVIWVNNTRLAISQIAACFYAHPAKYTQCIGVTGTNGKTTSVYIIETLLKGLGEIVAAFSTIDHHACQQKWPTSLTTPMPIDLHQRLSQIPSVDYLVMEVSSHALSQYRVDGLKFSATLWTHLTQDHLDYHGCMDNYFKAKQRLFSKDLMKKEGICVINTDDPWGQKLSKNIYGNIITYGYSVADVQILKYQSTLHGLQIDLLYKGKQYQADLKLIGQHNVMNFAGSVALLIGMGYKIQDILKVSNQVKTVPGRLELVFDKGFYGFVDYAHTSDALQQTLKSLRQINPGTKLITVFGCGGSRDKQKRPLMASIAEKYSDIVIITSDNPRNEDPLIILKDIEKGLTKPIDQKVLFSIADRKQAILKGMSLARRGDILLIAGKGHEEIQIFHNKIIPFSDKEVLRSFHLEGKVL